MAANASRTTSPALDSLTDPPARSGLRKRALSSAAARLTSADAAESSARPANESICEQLTALLQAQAPGTDSARSSSDANGQDGPALADWAERGSHGGRVGSKAGETTYDFLRTVVAGHRRSVQQQWMGAFIAGLIVPVAAGGVVLLVKAAGVKPLPVITDSASPHKSAAIYPLGSMDLRVVQATT